LGVFDEVKLPDYIISRLGKYYKGLFQTKYRFIEDGLVDVYTAVDMNTALIPITVFIALLVKPSPSIPDEPLLRIVELKDIGEPVNAVVEVTAHSHVCDISALHEFMDGKGLLKTVKKITGSREHKREILRISSDKIELRITGEKYVVRTSNSIHIIPIIPRDYELKLCGDTVYVLSKEWREYVYDMVEWRGKLKDAELLVVYDTEDNSISISLSREFSLEELTEENIDALVEAMDEFILELVRYRGRGAGSGGA